MKRVTVGDPRLGQRMRELRRTRGRTQEALAKGIHIKADKLSRFEQGKQLPTTHELRDFANTLRLGPELWRDLKRLWDQAQVPDVVRRLAQGQYPERVFADLYPCVYAADAALTHAYVNMAETTATFADAYAGLRHKRVLDVGCGYGLTTVALAAFGPREIVAVDNSQAMLDLLHQVLRSGDSLDVWLRSKGADAVLDQFYAPTLTHLQWMRTTFQGGLFRRPPQQGVLRVVHHDGLTAEQADIGLVDVVVANNYLHWPVNQRINQLQGAHPDLTSEQLLAQATRDALRPLATLLPPKGLAVITETKDFVTIDQCPDLGPAHTCRDLEIDLERSYPGEHPRYLTFHAMVNRILKDEYGVERDLTQSTKLFQTSTLPAIVQSGGFALRRIHLVERTLACDPFDNFFVRLPMLLGTIDIPLQEKIALTKRVRRELGKTPFHEILQNPLRSSWFFLVLERM